jgi:dolichol-phosphate mannosyltransferase
MLYVLGSWFAGLAVQGWASIMATMLIIGSVQLIVIGILGEYIGRLYMQSKARPLFIVDQVLRDEG